MGTDRKRPLAAFIVVTVIAVILLVTSVRSQAAPGWLDRRLPPSVVAIVPSPGDSGLWRAAGDGMDEVVRHGTALAHTVDGGEPTTESALAAASLLVTGTLPPPATHARSTPQAGLAVTPAAPPPPPLAPSHPTTHHRPRVDGSSGESAPRPRPARHHRPADPADSLVDGPVDGLGDGPVGTGENHESDHGRHHGWQGGAPGLWGGGTQDDADGRDGDGPDARGEHGHDTSTGERGEGGREHGDQGDHHHGAGDRKQQPGS